MKLKKIKVEFSRTASFCQVFQKCMYFDIFTIGQISCIVEESISLMHWTYSENIKIWYMYFSLLLNIIPVHVEAKQIKQ